MWTEEKETEGSKHQDIFEDEESDSTCPRKEDVAHFQGTPGCKSCRYVLVRTPKTFDKAQVSDKKTWLKVKGRERHGIKTCSVFT